MQLELARVQAELAALSKSLTSWLEHEGRKQRRAAWVEARREEQKRFRVGPPSGYLVGGGLLLVGGAQMLAFDPDDFVPIATPVIVVGGLLAVTGVITLTRALRKRRAIDREIELELRRPLPSPSVGLRPTTPRRGS